MAVTGLPIHEKPKPRSRYLNTSAAAEHLDIGVSSLTKLCLAGKGPKHYRVGSLRKFLREDLDAWMQARAVEPGEPTKSA